MYRQILITSVSPVLLPELQWTDFCVVVAVGSDGSRYRLDGMVRTDQAPAKVAEIASCGCISLYEWTPTNIRN